MFEKVLDKYYCSKMSGVEGGCSLLSGLANEPKI